MPFPSNDSLVSKMYRQAKRSMSDLLSSVDGDQAVPTETEKALIAPYRKVIEDPINYHGVPDLLPYTDYLCGDKAVFRQNDTVVVLVALCIGTTGASSIPRYNPVQDTYVNGTVIWRRDNNNINDVVNLNPLAPRKLSEWLSETEYVKGDVLDKWTVTVSGRSGELSPDWDGWTDLGATQIADGSVTWNIIADHLESGFYWLQYTPFKDVVWRVGYYNSATRLWQLPGTEGELDVCKIGYSIASKINQPDSLGGSGSWSS